MRSNLLSKKVTICIPSSNSEATIKKTITSILGQSYKNYDIFFFDNGSSDNTINIINHYINKFKNFKKFVTKKRIESGAHFNKILKNKHRFSNFFCVFHSDDIYNKNILKFSTEYLEHNLDCAAVSSIANIIDENDNIFSKSLSAKKIISKKTLKLDSDIFLDLLFENNNFLTFPSFVFRTESFIRNNYSLKYNKFKRGSDVNFYLQILKNEKIGIINKQLINYRMSKYGSSLNDLKSRTKDSDLFLVLKDVIKNYKNKNHEKYFDYHKKFQFLLMKDRCRQLINVKSQGIKKNINLNILANIYLAFYSLQNLKLFLFIILIKFFAILPFSRFFIKKISVIARWFGYVA
jgi:glycosyltransferase involved in cell wall biosynthesis